LISVSSQPLTPTSSQPLIPTSSHLPLAPPSCDAPPPGSALTPPITRYLHSSHSAPSAADYLFGTPSVYPHPSLPHPQPPPQQHPPSFPTYPQFS
ncbi:MAG: hypothetical protein Q8P67_10250, partial [archaeon]|nr:hypothetical protein [archaeon]